MPSVEADARQRRWEGMMQDVDDAVRRKANLETVDEINVQ
jgi:hypothetical protein